MIGLNIKINQIYTINSAWTYDGRIILIPVPNNIIKIIDIFNNNIAFEYIGGIYNNYKFLLSLDEFMEKLNPILIEEFGY